MTTHIAFVFPGQGSQSIGMLNEHAQHFPIIEQTFAQASTVLGYDLWQLVQQGSPDELNQTMITQPALLTAGVALWRVWQQLAEQQSALLPHVLAGHSLGEYTALVCAQALDFVDAVALVAERGRLMQDAVPIGEGAMAAIIGLSRQQVDELCQTCSGDSHSQVTAANDNAHGQVVVAGHTAAVEAVIDAAKPAGAKLAKRLPMSVPSHCQLMQPAADALQDYLVNVAVQTPTISVINNVDVEMPTKPDKIRDALVRQLVNPVRWVETIESMAQTGVNTVIECGPGSVLTGLCKRIDKTLQPLALDKHPLMRSAIDALQVAH